jgi:hypothetical protein
VLPIGSAVSQNNVAREAGLDPTALKKARYPTLVAEIQQWVSEQPKDSAPSQRQVRIAARDRNRSLKERLVAFQKQRDCAQSLLVEADATILDLHRQLVKLQARVDELQGPTPTTLRG